jgi:hypothetical protein
MKKIVCLVLFLSLFISGCGTGIGTFVSPIVSGAAGGYIYWKGGEAIKYYDYDSKIINKSACRAFKQMGLPVTKQQKKGENGFYIIAGDKDRFKVQVTPAQDNITRVTVRVNFLGDKPYVELFYKYLDDQINVVDYSM